MSHTISDESFKPNELSLRLAAERARIRSLIDQNFKKLKEKKTEANKTYIYVALVQFTNRNGKLGICHWSLAKDKLVTKCKESFVDIILANSEAAVSLDVFQMDDLNSVFGSTPAMYDRMCNLFMGMMISPPVNALLVD